MPKKPKIPIKQRMPRKPRKLNYNQAKIGKKNKNAKKQNC